MKSGQAEIDAGVVALVLVAGFLVYVAVTGANPVGSLLPASDSIMKDCTAKYWNTASVKQSIIDNATWNCISQDGNILGSISRGG